MKHTFQEPRTIAVLHEVFEDNADLGEWTQRTSTIDTRTIIIEEDTLMFLGDGESGQAVLVVSKENFISAHTEGVR